MRGRGVAVLAILLGLAGPLHATGEPRFFIMGSGTLTLRSRATGEEATVRYRQPDGRYDYVAFEDLQRILRSKGGGEQKELTPRFVEMLAYVSQQVGQPLVILSGYRTPAYNDGIRRRGGKAASGSLHTEGLAADLAIPREQLYSLWMHMRALDCCGAGYYAKQGFVHVDVGKPRFWEATTSRTDEDLSGGNARVFARADFDRYKEGETMLVRLHGVTAPPLRIARTAHLLPDGGGKPATVTVEDMDAPGNGKGDDCLTADAASRLLVKDAPATARGRIVFATCAPRIERTPERIESNPLSIR